MDLAKSERAGLCDEFDKVGPDAPTLCEGWDAHDLAVHLWIRETDPLGAPGILARPLARLTEKRSAETRARWSFTELVERIRRGPARTSVFAIPGVDEAANAVEFLVHHEDVRRAGDNPAGPRDLDPEIQDWVWRRLRLMGRAFYRRSAVGVALERNDTSTPDSIRAAAGNPTITIVGPPVELLLHANGRTSAAAVELIGEPEAIAAFQGTDLGI